MEAKKSEGAITPPPPGSDTFEVSTEAKKHEIRTKQILIC